MKIIFWGTPEFSVSILNSLSTSGFELVSIITQPDKRRGRGKQLIPSPVKKKGNELGIKVFTTPNICTDRKLIEQLAALKADLYVVVAFGQILPKEVLDQPRLGCWNIHASLLPRWRGAAPIQWSILSGDKSTGVAIMSMEEGLDTGPVLIQRSTDINLLDNYYTLSLKLVTIAINLLHDSLKFIDQLDDGISIIDPSKLGLSMQKELTGEVTYARQLSKVDRLINWTTTTQIIHRQVMGMYPNAYTFLGNKRLKILASEPVNDSHNISSSNDLNLAQLANFPEKLKPGQILSQNSISGILVVTQDGFLIIREAQLEGKSKSYGISLSQQISATGIDLLGSASNSGDPF